VFDPAGTTPLPDVLVWILNGTSPVPPFTPGTQMCSCAVAFEDYVTYAITDATGAFTMPGVPTGSAVPVTVQTGKWRRTINVDIEDCAANTVSDGTLRLPRSRAEGDMPQMPIVTGGADDLGCSLRRMGIDPGEYSTPLAGGRLDVYRGVAAAAGVMTGTGPGLSSGAAGDCTTASCPLWASKAALERYDMVLLSCEGDPYMASKPPAAIQAMHDWLNEGGKLFALHSQSVWFQRGASDFQAIAGWRDFSPTLGSGLYAIERATRETDETFDAWLEAVQGAQSTLSLSSVSDSVASVSDNASEWIYDPRAADFAADAALTGDPKILSFETPVGGIPGALVDAGPQVDLEYCGEAVFSDVHAGTAPAGDLPDACPLTPLSAEEKLLEYFFFDQPECKFYTFAKGIPPP
jgi:hypothetical protein